MSRLVFADTGAWVALVDPRDRYHDVADRFFRASEDRGLSFITTNVILYEAHAVVLHRTKRNAYATAMRVVEAIESGAELIVVGLEEQAAARRILVRHSDKSYSFCDAISFAVMERIGITQAISYDRDFRQFGRFTLVGQE